MQTFRDAATLLFLLLVLLTVRVRPVESSATLLGEVQASDRTSIAQPVPVAPEPLVVTPASACEPLGKESPARLTTTDRRRLQVTLVKAVRNAC